MGKTNILRRINDQDFEPTKATIGTELYVKDLKLKDESNKEVVISLKIWDTAGAEKYKALALSHIRNADGAFIVYDITNVNSFMSVHQWNEDLKASNNEDITVFLLGNKKDLEGQRTVSEAEGRKKAKEEGFEDFCETSAKTKENIMEMFNKFYLKVYEKNKGKIIEKRNNNKLLFEKKKASMDSICC